MKKFIVFILCLLLSGCEISNVNGSLDLFDVEKALEVGSKYMSALSEGEINIADSLCRDKFISNAETKKLEKNKFISYKVKEKNEGADFVYIKYLVIRGNDVDVRADLDSIELRVNKIEKEYKITEVKAKNLKQVYLDKDNIRIIDGETGKSNLLLRKKDLPKEVFKKGDEITLTMDTVSDVDFRKINIGFQGKSVGMALSSKNKVLVIFSLINDVKNSGSSSGEGEAVSENIEAVLEKPISEKIVGYDLVDANEIEKVLFTDNDEALVIQLKKEGTGSEVRIYKNPSGELMNFRINEKFPGNKYSLDVRKITEEGIYVYVKPIADDSKEEGTYIISIKKMSITKDD